MEHEDQCMVARVRVQEGRAEGQEARFQEQHDHVRYQRILGE